jgi:serine-threonine kinase receptor-associated protein
VACLVRSVWDARTLTQVKQLDTSNPVTSIELSRDGLWMTTCAGRDINFWDLNKCVAPSFPLGASKVAVSLRQRAPVALPERVLPRGANGHARPSRLEVVKTHTMEFEMESASLHPGGEKFVAGGEDMWVRLYDFSTGGELGAHPSAIA